MTIDKKQKKIINRIIQVVILLFIIFFFYEKFEHEELILSLNYILHSFDDHYLLWSLIILFMPANWLLEAWKWKKLCSTIFTLSLLSSFKGVLTGLAVSFVTPHGWGDYVGRIAILRQDQRERLIGALMFGRMAQLFITVAAGILGLIMYFKIWPYLYFWYILSFVLVAFLMAFNKSLFKMIRPYLKRLSKYFAIIKSYNAKLILEVLILSAIRYAVFTIQFFLIMRILNIDLSTLILLSGITWIFLIKSIIPSFNFLSDLGIREVSAIMFFEGYMTDVTPVISATLIIWIINIFVPSVIGSSFIFSIKAFR